MSFRAAIASRRAPPSSAAGITRLGSAPIARSPRRPAKPVPMIDAWDVIGLRATGSDSIAVKDLFVRGDHSIVREAPTLYCDRPLYRYSQMGIYALGFAGTALGVARAVVDEFLALAKDKKPRLVAVTHADN